VSGGASVAGNLYVETNARIKGFMSVNGNTGIYGNVVLTLRLSSDRHGSIDNGSHEFLHGALIDTGGWVGGNLYVTE
jgi:hypothetical protein